MAAYAAVVSLMNTIDNIRNHPLLSTSLDMNQIQGLCEKLDFFLDFVESYYFHGGVRKQEEQILEGQIASAADAAEDIIESRIVDLIENGKLGSENKTKAMRKEFNKLKDKIRSKVERFRQRQLAGSTEKGPGFLINLQTITENMDSINEKVMKVKEQWGLHPEYSLPAATSKPLTTGKNTMVGFDEELIQLMDVLTGQQSCRQIISIVGMGGSGKTTLARNVYENSLILQHFDFCAWATISQDYNVGEILLELLTFQGKHTNETVDELGERLYKSLSGSRYLIILDDMWSIEVWDKMRFFFPDNGCRSRLVITTRLLNVAIHCGSTCFRMNFLDEDKSWTLFCQKVFGQEDCPSELVEIGKKIVEQCRGLPLSIVVIGGFLRKSNRTTGYWQDVANNINSILISRENEQCLDILYLSYSHLPAHLKPCFLYLGIFKEDYEIRISEIIKLWVAEGFLKANSIQISEEIAEVYLEDLVDRNLILVCTHRPNGKIRSCRIHDLLKELCLRVAKRETFFCVAREHSIPQGIDRERCLVFYGSFSRDHHKVFEASQSAQLTRSLTCEVAEAPIKFRLLRVLNKATHWYTEAKFQNVNLRYFAYQPWLRWSCMLPSSISLIWNLQTLIIRDSNLVVAPLEIWKMPQLRHLKCSEIFLPEPPPRDKKDESFVLGNLQTLANVVNFRWNVEACKRIPNIKKLCITYSDIDMGWVDHLCHNLHNLGHLQKLESLNMWCFTSRISIEVKNVFPSSLKRLSLRGCSLCWKDLTMIGSLPQLEVLKLKEKSVVGDEWSPVGGEFLSLKFLSFDHCDLRCWKADGSHFPVLEKLVLRGLWKLKEIPLGIGEIPTLQLIHLDECYEDIAISAMKIAEEQESLGNDGLRIQVWVYQPNQRQQLMERMEVDGMLSISNIQLLKDPRYPS